MNARAQWLEDRRTGIGSSDVAAILGVCPPSWGASAHSVWLDKMGWAEPRDGAHLAWGHDMEPAILAYVAREHGLDLRPNKDLYRHPVEPWAVATPDALVYRDGRPVGICEVKNYGQSDGWGRDGDEAGDGTVPDHVRLQVWHQQMATGLLGESYVAASLWGRPPRLYPIAWEPAYETAVVPQLRAFWALVEARTPPAVDASDACREVLQRVHPLGDDVVERPDLEEQAARVVALQRVLTDADAALRLAKNELLAAVGSARKALAGAVTVTRVAVAGRQTLDTAALRAEMPEAWERYARVGAPSEYIKVTKKG